MEDIDSPLNFHTELSSSEKDIIKKWINENIKPRKTFNGRLGSYGLKHCFEYDKKHGGFYMSNGAFKGAMLACKYKPKFIEDTNWIFRISSKSPVFKKHC